VFEGCAKADRMIGGMEEQGRKQRRVSMSHGRPPSFDFFFFFFINYYDV
jgi:hypothetical protein